MEAFKSGLEAVKSGFDIDVSFCPKKQTLKREKNAVKRSHENRCKNSS